MGNFLRRIGCAQVSLNSPNSVLTVGVLADLFQCSLDLCNLAGRPHREPPSGRRLSAAPGQELGTEKREFRKIEIGLGRHFWHPYAIELSVSVGIDLRTPYGCIEPRTEGF